MVNKYWLERMAASQAKITEKNRKQLDRQLRKYYMTASKRTIEDFEATYNKLLSTVEAGREPTPADLYKLDKYWQAQAQLENELRKLGNRQIASISKAFRENWFEVYYSISLESQAAFSTIDDAAVNQLIAQIWCADGKAWSERVWENTKHLADTLNEELIHCVATGKPSAELKGILQERFNVSFSQADTLVRTELSHIQTEAAKKRYQDYGIQEVEILADADERRCEICGKLHGKRYPIGANIPIPSHPRCRCSIVPVVEI